MDWNWLTEPLLTIGGARVSLVKLAQFLAAIVLVVVAARLIGRLVGTRLLALTGMQPGLRFALGRIAYYLLLFLGLTIALQTSGIEVSSLTVVLGALGVGVGFGLQNIVNNFVSGLILLAERSIQIGDWIDMGGTAGRVTRIGARSTTLVTGDNITMIIPNGDLVSQRIINWSHGDPKVRFRIPVGVAYGSDLERVRQALLEVASAHPQVLPDPPPAVLFSAFGDSSLDMELAVWTREMVTGPIRFRSELNFAIDAAFRRHGIQIPFPQRDVHLQPAPPPAPQPGEPPSSARGG